MTGKGKAKKNGGNKRWENNRTSPRNADQRIPQFVKDRGLSAINKCITYQRLTKSDLIEIIMGQESDEDEEDEDTDPKRSKNSKGKRKRDIDDLDERIESLEKGIKKIVSALKTSKRRLSRNLTEASETESEDEVDLLEELSDEEDDDDYHKVDVKSIKKMLRSARLTVKNTESIKQVVSTIKKHEYNYRGNDKNKVKEIGTKLYTLKKKYKVAVGTMDNATMGNAHLPDQRVGRATPPPQTCERRNKQMEEQRNRVQRASDKTRRRF